MYASDRECSDAHAYTRIETRVCLVQRWKQASAALSLKAVYCDRHTAFSPLSPLFSPSHLNVPVAHFCMLCGVRTSPCCICSLSIASA